MKQRNLDAPNLVTSAPFIVFHLACGLVALTGVSPGLIGLAVGSYYLRMFFITAGYHRYFSHRTFRTNRAFQFVMAFMAQTSSQKGALWWAAHHRHHHRFSDKPEDIHSPARRGFWWSHVGWILAPRYDATPYAAVKDLARYPELVWLNEHHLVPVLVYHVVLGLLGGLPAVVWGGIVSTVLLWHGTFTINSLSHVFGHRRYATTDTSRNNWLLAIVTCGEGWHNNHHFHQGTANQGWFWWEIDATFIVLLLLERLGLVSHLRRPSEAIKSAHLAYSPAQREELAKQGGFFRVRLPVPTAPLASPSAQPET